MVGAVFISTVDARGAGIVVKKSILDPQPIAVADLLVNEEAPEAAHNILDDEFLVVYERQGVIIGQRMSSSGELLYDPFSISDSGGNEHPSVAFNPLTQSYVVAWEDDEGGQVDIWAISVAGTHQSVGDQFFSTPYAVTNSTTDQTRPSIACNMTDSSCLIVYEYHQTSSFYEIHAARVSVGATTISSDGAMFFLIAFNDFISHEDPDVVWGDDEGNYLVTWVREDGGIGAIWYARIYDTDQGLSSEIMTSPAALWPGLSNDQLNQDAAYDPSQGEYLVVFEYDAISNKDIWGVRVPGSSGSIAVSDLMQITTSSDFEVRPSVAHFNGVFPTYDGASAVPKFMIAYMTYQSVGNEYRLTLRSVVLEESAWYLYDEGVSESYDAADAYLRDSFLVGSWGNERVYVFWEVKNILQNHYDIYALGLNSELAFLPLIIK